MKIPTWGDDRLKYELENGFQGAGYAGRPLLLEGGLDWTSMSMSPMDLDFMEASRQRMLHTLGNHFARCNPENERT